jgi:deoxyribonuclease (pyrimidine dimer)
MTRINLVHVQDLADQHLFAEWREIKMIPAKFKKLQETWIGNELINDIPKTYTMSTGHVRFFYDKMYFLYQRYNLLTEELHKRDFNIAQHNAEEIFLSVNLLRQRITWEPTIPEIKINVERISLRLNERPNWYRYYGDIVPPIWFIDRYNQQMTVDKIAGI